MQLIKMVKRSREEIKTGENKKCERQNSMGKVVQRTINKMIEMDTP